MRRAIAIRWSRFRPSLRQLKRVKKPFSRFWSTVNPAVSSSEVAGTYPYALSAWRKKTHGNREQGAGKTPRGDLALVVLNVVVVVVVVAE